MVAVGVGWRWSGILKISEVRVVVGCFALRFAMAAIDVGLFHEVALACTRRNKTENSIKYPNTANL